MYTVPDPDLEIRVGGVGVGGREGRGHPDPGSATVYMQLVGGELNG